MKKIELQQRSIRGSKGVKGVLMGSLRGQRMNQAYNKGLINVQKIYHKDLK